VKAGLSVLRDKGCAISNADVAVPPPLLCIFTRVAAQKARGQNHATGREERKSRSE